MSTQKSIRSLLQHVFDDAADVPVDEGRHKAVDRADDAGTRGRDDDALVQVDLVERVLGKFVDGEGWSADLRQELAWTRIPGLM